MLDKFSVAWLFLRFPGGELCDGCITASFGFGWTFFMFFCDFVLSLGMAEVLAPNWEYWFCVSLLGEFGYGFVLSGGFLLFSLKFFSTSRFGAFEVIFLRWWCGWARPSGARVAREKKDDLYLDLEAVRGNGGRR